MAGNAHSGRKPFGARAMSDAERQRRHRRKLWGPDPWWSHLELKTMDALMRRLKPVRGKKKARVGTAHFP